jgi:methionyl-tRNA formyltransferase
MSNKINFAFWGTPDLTIEYLNALEQAGFLPVVVITNPDRPKGRGHELSSPAPKLWAADRGIPVLQPEKLDDNFSADLSKFDLDISIVVAYGRIISQELIDLPRHKTLNVHYSLLPKYRGAAPTESAILAGDTETGCSIQVMAFKLDSGPIISEEKIQIGNNENTTELRGRLTTLGAKMLVEVLPKYIAGETKSREQDNSQATRSKKIKKEDGLIDPNGDSVENYRKFRAYIEWPRTYFFQDTKRVIIIAAKFEHNTFVIEKVLPEGKKEIAYSDFLRNLKQ